MEFDLGTILTVTTGRLLTPSKGENDNGIDNLYKILEWMTGESPFTHTLGRFADECSPYLLKQFPELKNADVDILDEMMEKFGSKVGIQLWLLKCVRKWGMKEIYNVKPLPKGIHEYKNPLTELFDMVKK